MEATVLRRTDGILGTAGQASDASVGGGVFTDRLVAFCAKDFKRRTGGLDIFESKRSVLKVRENEALCYQERTGLRFFCGRTREETDGDVFYATGNRRLPRHFFLQSIPIVALPATCVCQGFFFLSLIHLWRCWPLAMLTKVQCGPLLTVLRASPVVRKRACNLSIFGAVV